MKTVELLYEPGDVLEYISKDHGLTRMKVSQVKVILTKSKLVIKYGGCPDYQKYQGYGLIWLSDIKQITLVSRDN